MHSSSSASSLLLLMLGSSFVRCCYTLLFSTLPHKDLHSFCIELALPTLCHLLFAPPTLTPLLSFSALPMRLTLRGRISHWDSLYLEECKHSMTSGCASMVSLSIQSTLKEKQAKSTVQIENLMKREKIVCPLICKPSPDIIVPSSVSSFMPIGALQASNENRSLQTFLVSV
ncbi:uncharacterized protein MONOS_15857 [Monocercomonoides exilis]|uniref:uncharacterized protein n=1 Tax=Monocercomonoides exilis TaxID=2049356 RepID=UPI0035599B66|nr:hypothetical protein MONOS_15857 [Monocercomonoides exilis]|eukprot:MONOS_15857.1-p1 / transcript=MONOS_15857.1 / gene=MONOS_15857 / organism=Monocercomonoides_exilis_PA203 / gene_product=unspecified product / transcript_product=unspecified product / location=Mono_scaffold01381:4385-4900(-) / protein_length=172 / sequence_SO=supercontig / SO=protein_coding / is_pseudo=false